MSEELVIVPSDGDGFVELARTKTGRLFRKHILSKGELIHPNSKQKITIDDAFVSTLTKNFNDGVCPIVQVPLADNENKHTEAPDRNIGEVIGIEAKDNKVYAVLDVRDNTHADRIGKTYLGASAMLSLDYTDTRTGEKVGPTLLHSCVTNRPYVTNLEDYEEIVAATSDTSQGAVLLSDAVVEVEPRTEEKDDMADEPNTKETPKPSLEELFTALKTEHGIDVQSLQAKAAEGDAAAKLSQTLKDALADAGLVKLAAGDDADKVSTEDMVGAVSELATNNVALTDRVQKLERKDAEHAVQTLIGEGKVMPAQRKAYVELKLTNPAMFDQLIPAEPIVKLNNETGVTPPEDQAHRKDLDEEVARLAALANGGVKVAK